MEGLEGVCIKSKGLTDPLLGNNYLLLQLKLPQSLGDKCVLPHTVFEGLEPDVVLLGGSGSGLSGGSSQDVR